jgi:hypothetical protein
MREVSIHGHASGVYRVYDAQAIRIFFVKSIDHALAYVQRVGGVVVRSGHCN